MLPKQSYNRKINHKIILKNFINSQSKNTPLESVAKKNNLAISLRGVSKKFNQQKPSNAVLEFSSICT